MLARTRRVSLPGGDSAWGLLLWQGAVEARRAQELLQHEPGTEQLGPAGGRRAGLVLKSLAWLRARHAASGTQRTLQISMSEKTARFKPPKCSVCAEQLVRASAQPQPQSSCLQLCAELCPQVGEAEQKAGAILNELVHNSWYRQALPEGCVCALPKVDRNTQNAAQSLKQKGNIQGTWQLWAGGDGSSVTTDTSSHPTPNFRTARKGFILHQAQGCPSVLHGCWHSRRSRRRAASQRWHPSANSPDRDELIFCL